MLAREKKIKTGLVVKEFYCCHSLQVSHFKIGRKELDYSCQGFTNLVMAIV